MPLTNLSNPLSAESMGLFFKGVKIPKRQAPISLDMVEVPLPARVILPLRQYIGEPATPVVSVGDTVKVGQLIATAEQDTALPLHATISGRLAEVTEHLDCRGTSVPALIIESDGADSWIELPQEHSDIDSLGPSEILTRIKEAGLVLKGLAPIPLGADLIARDQPKTHLSLNGRQVLKRTDTLMVSALDREPSLAVNRYRAHIHHAELTQGIAALKALTGAQRTIFVVDKHFPPFPQLAELVAADEQEATRIVCLDGRRFPLGLPVPLLKAVVGREVPLPYGHPRDVGVALYDLDTTISLGSSIQQIPQVDSLITVGGGALARRGIVKVRIGTTIGSLIESLGGFTDEPARLILGGPLMGIAQYDLSIPITKDIPALFALTRDETALIGHYRQCINCGLCVRVCPVNLVPGMLSLYCAKDRFETAERQGLLSCLECGCCDYVCPSRRPLVHLFRHAKQQLMET